MARPKKEGLDYFPHDTNASSDMKVENLLLLFGGNGYAFYFLHLEYIYRENDFLLDVSDAETRRILCKKLDITDELYEEILQACLKRNLFDNACYTKKGKLTSSGIQKRAETVNAKREKDRQRYKKKVFGAESIVETPQSKVKESKVKESKLLLPQESENNIITTVADKVAKSGCGDSFKKCLHLFEDTKAQPANHIEMEALIDMLEYYGEEWLCDALKIMAENGFCKVSYCRGVLQKWKADGKTNKSLKEQQEEQLQAEMDAWIAADPSLQSEVDTE